MHNLCIWTTVSEFKRSTANWCIILFNEKYKNGIINIYRFVGAVNLYWSKTQRFSAFVPNNFPRQKWLQKYIICFIHVWNIYRHKHFKFQLDYSKAEFGWIAHKIHAHTFKQKMHINYFFFLSMMTMLEGLKYFQKLLCIIVDHFGVIIINQRQSMACTIADKTWCAVGRLCDAIIAIIKIHFVHFRVLIVSVFFDQQYF